VNVEKIKVIGEFKPRQKEIKFEKLPAIEQYDGIVFGSPVHAFSLAQPMSRYLRQIQSLSDKKIALFATKQLRFNWTGGNQAIKKMKKICKSKDGVICGSGIVVWSSKDRERMINEVADKISKSF